MEPQPLTQGAVLLRQALADRGWSHSIAQEKLSLKGVNLSRLIHGSGPSVGTAVVMRDELGIPIEAWTKSAEAPAPAKPIRKPRPGRRKAAA